jgi:hypothetical protein
MQDARFVGEFWARERRQAPAPPASPETLVSLLEAGRGLPEFRNGRKLRDYQETSFKWMVSHALQGSSCILGDEMGLGKTAQVRPQHPTPTAECANSHRCPLRLRQVHERAPPWRMRVPARTARTRMHAEHRCDGVSAHQGALA